MKEDGISRATPRPLDSDDLEAQTFNERRVRNQIQLEENSNLLSTGAADRIRNAFNDYDAEVKADSRAHLDLDRKMKAELAEELKRAEKIEDWGDGQSKSGWFEWFGVQKVITALEAAESAPKEESG